MRKALSFMGAVLFVFGSSAIPVSGEKIDVNDHLRTRLEAIKSSITDANLKNAFSSKKLQSVEFKGRIIASPVQFDFPNGVAIKNGVVEFDDSFYGAPSAFVSDTLENRNQAPQTMSVSLSNTFSTTESFTTTTALGAEATVEAEAGVVFAKAKVSATVSLSEEFAYSKIKVDEYSITRAVEVVVPGNSWIPVAIMGQKLETTIPWYVDVAVGGDAVAHFATELPARTEMWGVTLWEDSGYKGDSDFYGLEGGKKTLEIADLSHFNDKTTAIKITGKVKVQVFKDKNFKGDSKEFTTDSSNVGDAWNDKISSLKITSTETPPTPVGVMVYYHKDYGDRKKFFPLKGATCDYEIGAGNFNNKVSAIRLYGSAKATIYDLAACDVNGAYFDVTSDIKSLKDGAIKLNDKVSSLRVVFAGPTVDVPFKVENVLTNGADRKFTCEGVWEGVTVSNATLIIGESMLRPADKNFSFEGQEESPPAASEPPASAKKTVAPAVALTTLTAAQSKKPKPSIIKPSLQKVLNSAVGKNAGTILGQSLSPKSLNEAKAKLDPKSTAQIIPLTAADRKPITKSNK